eukprot:tig00021314_g20122.t1
MQARTAGLRSSPDLSQLTKSSPLEQANANDESSGCWSHKITGHQDSVLCLAVHRRTVYSGSQDSTIRAWDTEFFHCTATLKGHTRSVLALAVADGLLFSSSSDNNVKIWSLATHECVITLAGRGGAVPRSPGHVFALAPWDRYLFLGCQDTTVKRVDLEAIAEQCPELRAARVPSESSGHGEDRSDSPSAPSAAAPHTPVSSAAQARRRSVEEVVAQLRSLGAGLDELPHLPPAKKGAVTSPSKTGGDGEGERLKPRPLRLVPGEGEAKDSPKGAEPRTPGGFSFRAVGTPGCVGSPDGDGEGAGPSNPYDRREDHLVCGALDAAGVSAGSIAWENTFFRSRGLEPEEPEGSWVPLNRFSTTLLAGKHLGYVYSAVAAAGRIYTGSGDCTVKVWHARTLDCEQTLEGHEGSVLALAVAGDTLYSGSADHSVKVWISDGTMFHLKRTLAGHGDEVLALSVFGPTLFSGAADGVVKAWDTKTLQCFRTMTDPAQTPAPPPPAPSPSSSCPSSSSSLHAPAPACPRASPCGSAAPAAASSPAILALTAASCSGVFTGGSDNSLRFWGIEFPADVAASVASPPGLSPADGRRDSLNEDPADAAGAGRASRSLGNLGRSGSALWRRAQSICGSSHDRMVEMLRRFVALRSVSVEPAAREELWKAAKFTRNMLVTLLGAEVRFACPREGRAPVVLARVGNRPELPTVLFYGHYDVQPAGSSGWRTDPWKLTSEDGYLYGRGATDNKGPVVAVCYAVKELLEETEGELPVNVAFVVEGEEEANSDGLEEAILRNREWLADTQVILVSNNYWLGESRPCVTFGMRGRVQIELEITGCKRDLHSGVDGGTVHEPMVDLVAVLARLVSPDGQVLIPGFHDDVRPLSPDEDAIYTQITDFDLDKFCERIGAQQLQAEDVKGVLLRRWRYPTLTVHGVGPDAACGPSFSVIARRAVGRVSMRIVPDQSPAKIFEVTAAYVRSVFAELGSKNVLQIRQVDASDWWLGNPRGGAFKALARAVQEVWGERPMYVREGGTIPVTPFLEKTLGAPAVHLAMGQSSDQAHLANERIRYLNLVKGMQVVKAFLKEVGAGRLSATAREDPSPPFGLSGLAGIPSGGMSFAERLRSQH